MITQHRFQSVTWYDVINPSTNEVREILEECDFPADFSSDLTGMSPRTETVVKETAIKLTLDFPIVKRTDINHPHEIKFIAGKTYLITVRFEDMELIHRFSKEFEVLSILKRAGKRATGGHLLLALLHFIYEGLNGKLDYLEGRMQDIERELDKGNEKEVLFAISAVGRRLVGFKQTLSAHNPALSKFHSSISDVFPKSYETKVGSILAHYDHLLKRTTALSRSLEILRDTDNALLSAKQNEIMKTLTIMAFITFPLTLISSIFGMNTVTMPLTGTPGDFWLIIFIMAVASVGFFIYFKHKNWL